MPPNENNYLIQQGELKISSILKSEPCIIESFEPSTPVETVPEDAELIYLPHIQVTPIGLPEDEDKLEKSIIPIQQGRRQTELFAPSIMDGRSGGKCLDDSISLSPGAKDQTMDPNFSSSSQLDSEESFEVHLKSEKQSTLKSKSEKQSSAKATFNMELSTDKSNSNPELPIVKSKYKIGSLNGNSRSFDESPSDKLKYKMESPTVKSNLLNSNQHISEKNILPKKKKTIRYYGELPNSSMLAKVEHLAQKMEENKFQGRKSHVGLSSIFEKVSASEEQQIIPILIEEMEKSSSDVTDTEYERKLNVMDTFNNLPRVKVEKQKKMSGSPHSNSSPRWKRPKKLEKKINAPKNEYLYTKEMLHLDDDSDSEEHLNLIGSEEKNLQKTKRRKSLMVDGMNQIAGDTEMTVIFEPVGYQPTRSAAQSRRGSIITTDTRFTLTKTSKLPELKGDEDNTVESDNLINSRRKSSQLIVSISAPINPGLLTLSEKDQVIPNKIPHLPLEGTFAGIVESSPKKLICENAIEPETIKKLPIIFIGEETEDLKDLPSSKKNYARRLSLPAASNSFKLTKVDRRASFQQYLNSKEISLEDHKELEMKENSYYNFTKVDLN